MVSLNCVCTGTFKKRKIFHRLLVTYRVSNYFNFFVEPKEYNSNIDSRNNCNKRVGLFYFIFFKLDATGTKLLQEICIICAIIMNKAGEQF